MFIDRSARFCILVEGGEKRMLKTIIEFTDVAKLHWKNFIFVWLWPPIFLAFLAFEGFGYPILIFWTIWMPYYYWSLHIAAKPFGEKSYRNKYYFVWAILVPLLLWILDPYFLRFMQTP